MVREAERVASAEPFLSNRLHSAILSHPSLSHALASLLGAKLSEDPSMAAQSLTGLFYEVLKSSDEVMDAVVKDMEGVLERDPACPSYCHCFLNFKGFQACEAYRIGHSLWESGRRDAACALQSRVSEVLGVDIHPAARIGSRLLLDHMITLKNCWILFHDSTIFFLLLIGISRATSL